MPRGKHHGAHEEHENHERWLITYADMITLLMAFFVMMYGLSILDIKKFAEFKAGAAKQLGKSPAIEGGQGILLGGSGVADAGAPAIGSGPRDGADDAAQQVKGEVTRDQLDALAKEVRQRLDDAGLAGEAQLQVDPRGLVVYVADRVLFESGSAYLELDGRRVLDQVAVALANIDNQIIVEGHTDNVPTRGRTFPSNWELSTSRATQVLRWMSEIRGIPAPRLSAAGYADTHPRALNDTAQHRALNRRVEIIVVAAPEEGTSHGQEA